MIWKTDDKKETPHTTENDQIDSKGPSIDQPIPENISENQKNSNDNIFEELTPVKRQPKNGRRGSPAKAKLIEYKKEEVIPPALRKYRPGIEYEEDITEEELKRALSQPLPDVFASLNYKFSSRKN